MESTQESIKLPEEDVAKENLRVRKTAYIKELVERQRAAEDARLEQLLMEQKVIEDLRASSDDKMCQTEETRKYNREFQEHLNMQVFMAHGITEDKLMGMETYKNALYRGAAAVLFLLSLMLTVLCGVLHGSSSNICLVMFSCTAVEGALLGRRQKGGLDMVCKILYILIFPAMFFLFVCYELGDAAYGLALPYIAIVGSFITVFAVMSYFLYNPYRPEKKKMRDAKSRIRDIEKTAEKEIRKNRKVKQKEEKAQKLRIQEKDGKQSVGLLTRFKKRPKQPVDAGTEEPNPEAEKHI